jgi:signal transducing adaptor molecule
MATLKPTPSVAEAHAVTPLTRVHALHSFEPTKPNELAFKKGDLIGVVNRDDKDWWRGYLRGCTGLFLESSPAQLVAEAQQDASVLSRAASFGRLFTMLRDLDPEKDDVAGNEKIQDLYRSCMTLRPSIVKLIDKYSRMRGMLSSCKRNGVITVLTI